MHVAEVFTGADQLKVSVLRMLPVHRPRVDAGLCTNLLVWSCNCAQNASRCSLKQAGQVGFVLLLVGHH